MIITVDGPAGAGKGTLAKNLAKKLNFAYLDTGLLYRAVAAVSLETPNRLPDFVARNLSPTALSRNDLRTPEVAQKSSELAAIPAVRQALLKFQRQYAQTPPNNKKGCVLDGRDTGTVVCPKADYKFFLTATPEIRAKRRFLELQSQNIVVTYDDVLQEIQQRDDRDRRRSVAPLKPAEDAIRIDSSQLSADQVMASVLQHLDVTVTN